MRGGGYNLMDSACSGDRYPAALRDPLPGNDHHPNVVFRVALYVKWEEDISVKTTDCRNASSGALAELLIEKRG